MIDVGRQNESAQLSNQENSMSFEVNEYISESSIFDIEFIPKHDKKPQRTRLSDSRGFQKLIEGVFVKKLIGYFPSLYIDKLTAERPQLTVVKVNTLSYRTSSVT